MTSKTIPENEIRVELGGPVPFAGEKRRELLLAAALGAPLGTSDPVDLALLSAASHKEDLRHYEQLGYTPPTPEQRLSIARVRRVGSDEEELIARGEVDTILYLCRPDESTRYRADLQADQGMLHGFRTLAVAHGTVQPDGREKWLFLGHIPIRATRERSSRSEEPGAFRYVPVWDWQLRAFHWLTVLLIVILSITGILMGGGRFAYMGTRVTRSTSAI